MPVAILYNGKDFNSIEKAKSPEEDILLSIGMAQSVHDALGPLMSDIEKEGGDIIVNVKGPNLFEISTTDLSDTLKLKVLKALTPPD
jgi:hypothetical protein